MIEKYNKAIKIKSEYKLGRISQAEAKDGVKEYIEMYNKKAKAIAKKHGMKPRFISALKFIQ